VDGNYAADGSRFNAIVGDASEAAEARQPRYQNHAMSMSMWLTLAMDTYVDGRLAGDGRRGDRVRPAAATQPRARASSSRRSRFWPHGLVTRVGHTGWPHGTWAAWNLPPVFRWRHPTTGDEIIVMNEQGYGR
jgi:hypothetical protein